MLGAQRLAAAFARARREGRLALVAYVMAGDPDLATTRLALAALHEAGADVVELGVPYSDPLADGPTIAAAGQRALQAGAGLRDVLELVRDGAAGAPIVLFTYYNPVYRYGVERFARDAALAGAAGAIVPDVTLEESGELQTALRAGGLAMPLLIAPSTPPARAERIAAAASGFVYVVSRLGVTGAGTTPDLEPLRAQLAALREVTEKPLAVGFGISCAEQVRAIGRCADGVVVGSALVEAYAGCTGAQAAQRVRAAATPLVAALPFRYSE